MTIKDYYSILEVQPDASALVIKKSFRRLALQYHPDKNSGNQVLEQKFKEINEAYRVLGDNKKRNDYNYSRFEKNGAAAKKQQEPLSVKSIMLQAKKLHDKVAYADPGRMNKLVLIKEVEQLLSSNNMSILERMKDEKANIDLVHAVIFVGRHLPYADVQPLIPKLVKLAIPNNSVLIQIRNFDNEVKYRTLWNSYKLPIVLIVVLLFCMLIFFVD